ncbi:MAG: glycosyltransferase [Candidatus Micrarchaeota archaeon]
MVDTIKVSICIPVYNGEKFLKKTIESILNQSYKNFEFLIVDNASTDKTPEIIQSFKDPRIRYYRNPKIISGQQNWSLCVELAHGDIVAIYHADDLYHPDIVKKQVQFFADHKDVGAVFTEATKIDAHDKKIGTIELPKTLKGKSIFAFKDIFIQLIKNNYNPLVCPSFMVRKDIFKRVGHFNFEDYTNIYDIDMYLRILEISNIGVINEKLINYRIHPMQGSVLFSTKICDHNEIYDMYDKLIVKYPTLLSKSDLARYDCFKKWDYTSHAIRALLRDDVVLAKNLLKKSFSVTRFFTSLTDINLFVRLLVSVFFLPITYLGLGHFFAKLLFKYKLGYIT